MSQFPLLNIRKVPFCIIDSCMDAPILMNFCNLLLLNGKKVSGKIVAQRHGWSPAYIGVTWTKLWHHRSPMAESKGERASDSDGGDTSRKGRTSNPRRESSNLVPSRLVVCKNKRDVPRALDADL